MATKRIEEISNSITDASQLQGNELFIVSAEDENETGYSTKKMDIQTIRDYVRAGNGGSDGGLSLDQIYPVGSVYTTISPTFDPNASFGGTWVKFGQGRCLWGCESDDNELGSELEGILPAHQHNYTSRKSDSPIKEGGGYNNTADDSPDPNQVTYNTISTPNNISVGDTLRPPSIGVIFWKRTA